MKGGRICRGRGGEVGNPCFYLAAIGNCNCAFLVTLSLYLLSCSSYPLETKLELTLKSKTVEEY